MTAPAANTIKVGVGPRNAYTSERGLRFYRWQGRDLPSVTTIRRMAGMPFNLHEWAIGEVTQRAVDGYADLGKILANGTPESIKAARSWLRAASIEKRDAAAELGTRVHDAAASGASITTVGADVAPYLRQYLDWREVSKAEIIAVEKQVFNLQVGYAGTFDLLCRFRDGTVWVVDLKTGKGTYTEHAIQCMAYAMAEFIGEDDKKDVTLTGHLHTASGLAILHIGPDGWEWSEVVVTPDLWRAYRGLLEFAVFMKANPKIDNLVRGVRKGTAA